MKNWQTATLFLFRQVEDLFIPFQNASGRFGVSGMITSNGAAIYDLSDDHSVYNLKLRPEVPEQIFDLVTDKDVFFECFIDGRGYTSEIYYENPMNFGESEDISAYVRSTRTPVPDIRQFILQHNTELNSISIVGPTEKNTVSCMN